MKSQYSETDTARIQRIVVAALAGCNEPDKFRARIEREISKGTLPKDLRWEINALWNDVHRAEEESDTAEIKNLRWKINALRNDMHRTEVESDMAESRVDQTADVVDSTSSTSPDSIDTAGKRLDLVLIVVAIAIVLQVLYPPFYLEMNGVSMNTGFHSIFDSQIGAQRVDVPLLVVDLVSTLVVGLILGFVVSQRRFSEVRKSLKWWFTH